MENKDYIYFTDRGNELLGITTTKISGNSLISDYQIPTSWYTGTEVGHTLGIMPQTTTPYTIGTPINGVLTMPENNNFTGVLTTGILSNSAQIQLPYIPGTTIQDGFSVKSDVWPSSFLNNNGLVVDHNGLFHISGFTDPARVELPYTFGTGIKVNSDLSGIWAIDTPNSLVNYGVHINSSTIQLPYLVKDNYSVKPEIWSDNYLKNNGYIKVNNHNDIFTLGAVSEPIKVYSDNILGFDLAGINSVSCFATKQELASGYITSANMRISGISNNQTFGLSNVDLSFTGFNQKTLNNFGLNFPVTDIYKTTNSRNKILNAKELIEKLADAAKDCQIGCTYEKIADTVIVNVLINGDINAFNVQMGDRYLN